jgi:DNA-binding protein HU-beta
VKASELAQTLADSVGIKKAQATELLKNLGVAITTTLKDGGEITIPGAGKFVAKHRAARTTRNPATGGTVEVPAKNVPAFKPTAELKRALAA